MPLPLPRLDTRTFDQLVAEGQVLLPRYAPSWTDYNAHDPGITLLELFAWLAEIGFYRLDRTSAASYRAFLRLAGIELRAAQVAETVVVASLKPPSIAAHLTAGVRVESADGASRFQTTLETSVSPARLVAVLAGPAGGLIDRSIDNLAGNLAFGPFSLTPQVDDALYLGFDGPLTSTPAPLSLFVSTGSDEQDRRTRALLQAEWESARADALKDPMSSGMAQPADTRLHYAARVAWEYHSGGGVWGALTGVEDETRSLTLSGIVRFSMPALPPHAAGGVAAAGQAGRFFIRCRLASGRYDCAPSLQSIRHNALRVRHAVDIEAARSLGVSNGRAAQVFALHDAPIVPDTTEVLLFDEAGNLLVGGAAGRPWREAPDWDRIGPHDNVYVVAHDASEVMFGDGRIGRVPPAGAKLTATYQVGGGTSGNVAAATLTRFVGSLHEDVAIMQPFDAIGGEDDEDLDAAIGRALAAQAAPTRTVTLQDIIALTLGMPGVPIARAEAIADYDPEMPCLPALGSITVVVIPRCPASRPDPSDELLCAVACYLERRRTLTTELHVVGPCFTTVSVQAQLHPVAGADVRNLADAARTALSRFLDPLHGGPDGSGWPVGRDVYRSEVMALLNDLPGVSYVDEVRLQIGDGSSARCGNASVCRHGLVISGTHQITIDSGSHCQ